MYRARPVRRWLIVIPAVVVVIAALSLGGSVRAQTSSGTQTARDRLPTVATFCAAHTSRSGFWSYGAHASFLPSAVNAARLSHRQFEAVAGTLCAMLRRLDNGQTVMVPDPRAPTHAPRQVHRPQVLRAIRELELLPDAR